MSAKHDNLLEQSIDIGGTTSPSQFLDTTDEAIGLGASIPGQTGSAAVLSLITVDVVTVNGLTGMWSVSEGKFLTLSGAANASNNGTFQIVKFNSNTSVDIRNAAAVVPDANSGSITWIERNSYMLADDLNYIRTDRREIKGTPDWYDPVPTYTRPDATTTDVSANLTNISGKTTDAQSLPESREIFGAGVLAGQSSITVISPGNLKHVDAVNTLGIPCFDVAPFVGDFRSCFVKILDGVSSGGEFTVLGGVHAGERIFGVTNNGASASPNSVEVIFYSCPLTADIQNSSTPYTWEVGQVSSVNLVYGYNQRIDGFNFNVLRFDLTLPASTSAGGSLTPAAHQTLRQLIHFISEGPGNGFATGAFKETLPFSSPFPTSIIWWESSAKLKKIVAKSIAYNPNKTPSTILWEMYATDGVTVIATVSDAISYSSVFETSRTRSIS